MKRAFYSILLFTGLCSLIIACSNGDYKVNPTAGNIINPLHPLTTSQFTWTGTAPLSCTVNGAAFISDSGTTTWGYDTSGGISIIGLKGGSHGILLYLKNTYDSTLYSMSYSSYNTSGEWIDSLGGASTGYYFSYFGNSGEVYVIENDSAFIKGYFYFEGVNDSGKSISIENGYFKIKK